MCISNWLKTPFKVLFLVDSYSKTCSFWYLTIFDNIWQYLTIVKNFADFPLFFCRFLDSRKQRLNFFMYSKLSWFQLLFFHSVEINPLEINPSENYMLLPSSQSSRASPIFILDFIFPFIYSPLKTKNNKWMIIKIL